MIFLYNQLFGINFSKYKKLKHETISIFMLEMQIHELRREIRNVNVEYVMSDDSNIKQVQQVAVNENNL